MRSGEDILTMLLGLLVFLGALTALGLAWSLVRFVMTHAAGF